MTEYKLEESFVEIYFESKPNDNIIETLKLYKFRWNNKKICWYAYKSLENIEFAKLICKNMNGKPKDPLLGLPKIKFSINTLLIRSNSFYCNVHHKVKDMAGEIEVCNRLGKIETFLVPIALCEECQAYFILEDTFKNLKKRGIVMCPVIDYKTYTSAKGNLNFKAWQDHSILNIYGYNVNCIDDLSTSQRWAILELLLDNKIITKDRMLSYLDFFPKVHNSQNAIQKWNEDRNYIANYKLGLCNRVRIGSIQTLR